METPLTLIVPLPSSIRLSQEALMTIASAPDVLGEDMTAYALVPLVFYIYLKLELGMNE